MSTDATIGYSVIPQLHGAFTAALLVYCMRRTWECQYYVWHFTINNWIIHAPRCHLAFFSGAFLRSINTSGSSVGVVFISMHQKPHIIAALIRYTTISKHTAFYSNNKPQVYCYKHQPHWLSALMCTSSTSCSAECWDCATLCLDCCVTLATTLLAWDIH